MPLAHALAYAIEILPALGYLHDRGLVYCDFKPDNVIQTEEQLKLIDMGGVRPIDGDGPIYGTVGYQAPEIEAEGPSPSSDLYTVGRALAVLTFEFAGYQGEYKYRLPDAVPLLAQQESFARLLRRATDPDPERRFQSAAEMAEQTHRRAAGGALGRRRPAPPGVLRPVQPRAAPIGTDLTPVRAADRRRERSGEPAACRRGDRRAARAARGRHRPGGGLPGHAGRAAAEQQAATLRAAVAGEPRRVPPAVAASAETRLALVRALITAGDPDGASAYLAEWPRPTRPTGGSPGTPGCATSQAAGRTRLGGVQRRL